jgi:AraC family transcriptional regulator, arabinose operon regulatory protein
MIKLKDGFSGEMALVIPQFIVRQLEDDPVLSMLHITDIGYYPHAKYHFRERKTPINQFVFIYCIDGTGWFKIKDKKYEVHANQYFILPAGMPHQYASYENNPWTIYWIHFKGKMAASYTENAAHPIDVSPNIRSRIGLRNDLFEEMFNTLKMGYSNENLRYVCSCLHYYLGSFRYLQQYRESVMLKDKNVNDPINATIHYMNENIGKRINLEEFAEYIGYSSSHFSMLFSKQTGYSPLTYFNMLKIQHSCQLLDFTDMKINQISYKVGIEDPYYFSRLFNKVMGMSPLKYRKIKKG